MIVLVFYQILLRINFFQMTKNGFELALIKRMDVDESRLLNLCVYTVFMEVENDHCFQRNIGLEHMSAHKNLHHLLIIKTKRIKIATNRQNCIKIFIPSTSLQASMPLNHSSWNCTGAYIFIYFETVCGLNRPFRTKRIDSSIQFAQHYK